ncbi:hypothetical protein HPB50_011020 [Hyalomma asiaticum]|uniref:Uncharacterized protein n=1 Tax=Hyalomma asiaticum TaxID=266040 RepID=A0ACB7TGE3_HYAAI|nr:hypothetical protein HPB50_011020 [Hyalomma asiaticum]
MGDTCDLEEPDGSTFDDPRRGRKSSRRGNAWLRQTHPTSPSNSIAFLRGPNLRFGPDIHPLQGSHRPGVEQHKGSNKANSSEASQELKLQKAIDADREAIVSEKLREATQKERDNIQETASQFSISAHSRASSRSRRSGSSTISLAAAQARAQAEAVKAKAEYGRKEAAMRLEKARIEAELEVFQHEKEAAAADAQASALEAAADQDGG